MIHFTLPQTASAEITVTSTATKITKLIDQNVEANNSIPSDLDAIDIYVESGTARYLINGTPTVSEGLALDAGKTYLLRGVFLKDFNVISGDSAVLTVSIGKTEYGEQSSIPSSTGGGAWGEITGTLSAQTDLQAALDAKENDYTGTWTSPQIKAADTVGSELLVNGSFDDWTDGTPDDWTITTSGATPGTIDEDTDNPHTEGGSAIEFTVGADHGVTIVSQTFTGLVAGSYLQIDTWAYEPSSNGAEPSILLLNAATIETATQVYIATNTTDGAWTDIVGGDVSPGVLQLNMEDVGDAWVGVSGLMVPRPSTGVVSASFFGSGDEGENCFIDDLSIKPYTYAPAKDLFTFTDTTDATNLNENDTVFKIETTGGTDFNHLSIDGEGSFDTDYDDFDFSSKQLRVNTAYDEEGALNAQTGMALLAVTPAINLKTTGVTQFKNAGEITEDYNLPSGYHLIGAKLVTLVTAADTLSGDFEVSVGIVGPNYTGIFNTFVPGNTTIGQTSEDISLYTGENGDVYLNLSKADAGTSGTAKFLLFGTLVSTDIA